MFMCTHMSWHITVALHMLEMQLLMVQYSKCTCHIHAHLIAAPNVVNILIKL